MLSMRDCLDYCDLEDEQVLLIAAHEHLEPAEAAHLMCGLAQSPDGVALLALSLFEILRQAQDKGDICLQHQAESAFVAFMQKHPIDVPEHSPA